VTRCIVAFGAVVLAIGCGAGSPESTTNVLLIVMDTTRADALGVSGSAAAATPHLDALAAEGTVYTHARTTSAWTVPSHGSLFTGLYPSNHGAHHEHPRLEADAQTLAEILSRTHQTAAFSENSFIQKGNGYAQGFHHFEEAWRERTGWSEPPPTLERARSWLSERDADRPFFLFINLMTPHLPYDPPPRHRERHVGADTPASVTDSLRNLGDGAAQRYMMGSLELGEQAFGVLRSLYLADVSYTDEQVGDIVEMVRSEGLLDETLVIVVGDHGENLGDHQLMEHQFSLNETLLRVPMILRLPGTVSVGERSDAPVQLVDVLPTVMDALGSEDDDFGSLDGRSLLRELPRSRPVLAELMLPVMQRRSYFKIDPSFDFGRFDRRLKSIQIGRWKLIASEGGGEELYDLDADPGETTNLASERPEELELLRAPLKAWIAGSWEPARRGVLEGVDENTLRELRALGYIK